MTTVHLAFENGLAMPAQMRAGSTGVGAEAVFTTAYTGYEESLTDPSYAGQALVFAYPLIGNYGVDERRFESDSVQPELVITREVTSDVAEWLDEEETTVVADVDTRSVVTSIREEGSMTCAIEETREDALRSAQEVASISEQEDIDERVGIDHIERFNPMGDPTIVLVDCGVKRSMISRFVDRGACVVRVPNDCPVEVMQANDPDLLFVSNGPGDPAHYEHVIERVRGLSKLYPVAGICLGQQIIAHAHDGETEQMKFGHRGSNQPVIPDDGPVKMTTQNHSFEVSDPGSLSITERNVNDESPEGLEGDNVLTRQYHPEASPGPRDSFEFFEEVIAMAGDG